MDYSGVEAVAKHAPLRLLRLFACAVVGDLLAQAKTRWAGEAVMFGRWVADYKTSPTAYEVANCRNKLKSVIACTPDGLRREVRRFAAYCVQAVTTASIFTRHLDQIKYFTAPDLDDPYHRCFRLDGLALLPGFITPEIRNMAREIHQSREYSDLPYLADALEENNLLTEEARQHLRDDKQHWHGCCLLEQLI